MTRPKAIFFDIDGTLVDSNDFHVEAWDAAFREEGHVIARDRIHAQIGKGGDNLVPALLPDLDDAAQKRLAARHGPIFKARFIDRVRPFPGARDLLVKAHKGGAKILLATSAGGEERDHYVELLDAAVLLDDSTSEDDAENTKPDPDIFAAALDKSGVDATDAIVVGDTPYDAEAAAKLGIPSVGLLSGGFSERSLRDAGAGTIYRDVAHLLAEYEASPLA